MPRIRYARPGRFGYKKSSTPRADLSKYNAARKVGYKPKSRRPITAARGGRTAAYVAKQKFTMPEFKKPKRVAYRNPYGVSTRGGRTAAYAAKQPQMSQAEMLRLPTGAGGTFTGHREAQRPITTPGGRRVRYVDPALMERIMSSPPSDSSGAFEQQDFYQGEDFVNYLYEQGIVPHWGNVQSPSGHWIDYLLRKMGVTQSGINPFAKPYQQPQPAVGGYGGEGGAAAEEVVGYTPPKPKQYGATRDTGGRNVPQWLLDMVVWNI